MAQQQFQVQLIIRAVQWFSPKNVIDITGTDPLSLESWLGRVNLRKLEKMRYF